MAIFNRYVKLPEVKSVRISGACHKQIYFQESIAIEQMLQSTLGCYGWTCAWWLWVFVQVSILHVCMILHAMLFMQSTKVRLFTPLFACCFNFVLVCCPINVQVIIYSASTHPSNPSRFYYNVVTPSMFVGLVYNLQQLQYSAVIIVIKYDIYLYRYTSEIGQT